MGNIVMGYWDCPYCGSKGVRGDMATCPNCGRGRGDVKFYMKDHQEGQRKNADQLGQLEYVDPEKAKYINRNPDWYCSFCNTLNSDNAKFCSNCGATRESSEGNYFDIHRKKEEEARERTEPVQRASSPKTSKRPLLILLVLVLAIGGLFAFLQSSVTQKDLTVSSFSWERIIGVEENKQFSESDWRLPDGVELTSSREELHHYDAVFDHYESVEVERSREVLDHYETYYTHEDMGNGYFEEVSHQEPVYRTEYYTETVQEPVYVDVPRYQTKYYYTIWRWVHVRDVRASGDDQEPYWPEVTYADLEREGERSEAYRFTVEKAEKGKEPTYTTYRIDFNDWQALKKGESIQITSTRTGADPYISDSQGNRIANLYRD